MPPSTGGAPHAPGIGGGAQLAARKGCSARGLGGAAGVDAESPDFLFRVLAAEVLLWELTGAGAEDSPALHLERRAGGGGRCCSGVAVFPTRSQTRVSRRENVGFGQAWPPRRPRGRACCPGLCLDTCQRGFSGAPSRHIPAGSWRRRFCPGCAHTGRPGGWKGARSCRGQGVSSVGRAPPWHHACHSGVSPEHRPHRAGGDAIISPLIKRLTGFWQIGKRSVCRA